MARSIGYMHMLLLPIMLSTATFWRLPCSNYSGIGRIDPIQSPGQPSDHTHIIFGGQNFGFSTTTADLQQSLCSSCSVFEDRSAYWVPPLYFTADNQTFSLVPHKNGLTVYYFNNKPDNESLSFPDGFRMVSGDSKRKTISIPVPDPPMSSWSTFDKSQDALRQKALGFTCLDQTSSEGALQRHSMPSKDFIDSKCSAGLRLEIMFPSCWDGTHLDSVDHRSHVAFPDLLQGGQCPAGFPIRLPALYYEITWQTYQFSGAQGLFVLSNGDPTGLSYHGDFLTGWLPGVLSQASQECTDPSGMVEKCSPFTLLTKSCQFMQPQAIQGENYFQSAPKLPGNHSVD